MEAEGITLKGTEQRVEVFGGPLGEVAGARMPLLLNSLRQEGISADMAYGGKGMKGAMKAANRSGAAYALVLGEAELAEGVVAVKDLAAHQQTEVPAEQLGKWLLEKLR